MVFMMKGNDIAGRNSVDFEMHTVFLNLKIQFHVMGCISPSANLMKLCVPVLNLEIDFQF